MYRVWNYVSTYSLLLIAGAVIALVWANIDSASYHSIIDMVLIDNFVIGHPHGEGGDTVRTLTLHYLINDVLMAFFFAIAGKEVWEAVALESGSLRGRRALTPLIATAGGMLGPVAVYLGLAVMMHLARLGDDQTAIVIGAATVTGLLAAIGVNELRLGTVSKGILVAVTVETLLAAGFLSTLGA